MSSRWSLRSKVCMLAAAAGFGALPLAATAPAEALIGTSYDASTSQARSIVRTENGCTGTLVNPSWVLTSALCADSVVPSSTTAVIGWHNRANPSDPLTNAVTRVVIQTVKHPSYRPASQDAEAAKRYDVALLRLNASVTDRPVIRIGAPGIYNDYDGVGETWKDATLFGWGQMDGGVPATKLRAQNTRMRDHGWAENRWGAANWDRTYNIAFGGQDLSGQGPCGADRGGPAMGSTAVYTGSVHSDHAGYIQMGVQSAIKGSCGVNPARYIRVDQGPILNWLAGQVTLPCNANKTWKWQSDNTPGCS
ncbi:trypsin-like serine protease [Actinocorallia sp. B10E7]|uniref:trypsin-like serine protease n=1 Tax=Actinocorallia sp. B10E7 TaxID=3153558 RepID=UPI00325E86FC